MFSLKSLGYILLELTPGWQGALYNHCQNAEVRDLLSRRQICIEIILLQCGETAQQLCLKPSLNKRFKHL